MKHCKSYNNMHYVRRVSSHKQHVLSFKVSSLYWSYFWLAASHSFVPNIVVYSFNIFLLKLIYPHNVFLLLVLLFIVALSNGLNNWSSSLHVVINLWPAVAVDFLWLLSSGDFFSLDLSVYPHQGQNKLIYYKEESFGQNCTVQILSNQLCHIALRFRCNIPQMPISHRVSIFSLKRRIRTRLERFL